MKTRKASIKETGEELSPEQWARFDAAAAEEKASRSHLSRSALEPFAPAATRFEPDARVGDETSDR